MLVVVWPRYDLRATKMALDLQPRAIVAAHRPIPTPYHYALQAIMYIFKDNVSSGKSASWLLWWTCRVGFSICSSMTKTKFEFKGTHTVSKKTEIRPGTKE